MSLTYRFIVSLCMFVVLPAYSWSLLQQAAPKAFSIMIDPAGDTHTTGRLIDETFERSITLLCAQQLKHELEAAVPHLQVVLTRAPGETVEPLQNANFANRLNVDLFIRVQFFYTPKAPPTLTIYRFSWGNELLPVNKNELFIRYDKAHLKNAALTDQWANKLVLSLKKRSPIACTGYFAVPCKPLIGIACPALCIEASLATKDEWQVYIKPLVESLQNLLQTL